MKKLAAVLVLCTAPLVLAIDSDGPVHQGAVVQIDYPAAKFVKNTGGRDGAGLCVFTSIQFAAEWANVEQLKDFQKWMRDKPGGGWPDKVDQMIARKCGGNAPLYLQYEGKDPTIIRRAVESGRIACVTYDGRDPFYKTHIEHMVCVVGYTDQWVTILDNNQGVDRLIWLTPSEFLSRWIDVG